MNNLYTIGTAYYPDYVQFQAYNIETDMGETVDSYERIRQDFARMKKVGIQEIRIGEFSWSTVEQKEGDYTPDLFLHTLDLAELHNISVIFCTPTATPPKWLIDKYPEILPVLPNDLKVNFGSRRHYDPCSEVYQEYSKKIVNYFAKTFGSHPAVKLWQIDNELGHHGSSALFTENSKVKFQKFLEEKYIKIENLNKVWATAFWSQGYTDFSQIELPKKNWTDNNPHTELDFKRFCTSVWRQYQKLQIDQIKSICKLPVTHNLISNSYELCPWEMTKDLDIVGFDHYQDYDHPTPIRSTTNFKLMDSLSRENTKTKFKILEQQPVQVNWQSVNRRISFDWLLLWTGQSAMCGANTMDYFSWQRFYGGSEQYHDGVLPHDVRNKESNQEKLIIATQKMLDHISQEMVWDNFPQTKQDILIIHNTESLWTHRISSQSVHYDTTFQLDELTATLTRLGLGFEYKNTVPNLVDLKKYGIIIFPGYAFEIESQESGNLKKFMESGGKIISFPRSFMKTRHNHMSPLPITLLNKDDFYLEEYGAMGPEEEELVSTKSGYILKAHRWIEKLSINEKSPINIIAKFKNGLYKGAPAIIKNSLGLGHHIHFCFCPIPSLEFAEFILENFDSNVLRSAAPESVQIFPLLDKTVGIINFGHDIETINTKLQAEKIFSYTLDKNLKIKITSDNTMHDGCIKLPARSFTIIKNAIFL